VGPLSSENTFGLPVGVFHFLRLFCFSLVSGCVRLCYGIYKTAIINPQVATIDETGRGWRDRQNLPISSMVSRHHGVRGELPQHGFQSLPILRSPSPFLRNMVKNPSARGDDDARAYCVNRDSREPILSPS